MYIRRLIMVLLATYGLSLGSLAPAVAGEPDGTPDGLAAAARAALDSWKYEAAGDALAKLAKAAPGDPRLLPLRLEFLVRVGRFREAAEAAGSADAALAGQLGLDSALKVGRSLAAFGHPDEGRRWVLAAVRRAGPAQTARFADSLAVLIAPRGAPGLVTPHFAAEMALPEAERAEAAAAYRMVAETLGADGHGGSPGLMRAGQAAKRRMQELLGEAGADLAKGRLLWQVPVGIDEQPEHVITVSGTALVASRASGQPLPGMPLADKLRAFDLGSGAQLWGLDMAPVVPAADAAGIPGPSASFCGRVAGMVAAGERVYVLVRTERFEMRGASRTGSVVGAAVVALESASGKRVWSAEAPRESERLYRIDDRLVAAGFRSLAGFSARDGVQLWAQELERALSGEGAPAAGSLVMPGWRETVAVNPADGSVRWTVPRLGAAAAVVRRTISDGKVVAFGESEPGTDTMRLLEAGGGRSLWTRTYAVPRAEGGEMAMALAESTLDVARGAVLRGLAISDGNAVWRAVLPPPSNPESVGTAAEVRLAMAGKRVLWAAGGALVALEPATGRVAWWASAPSPEARPVSCPEAPAMALALTGSAVRSLCAWRLPDGADAGAAVLRDDGRKLAEAAEKLARNGQHRAVAGLLDIARTVAAPGSLDVELAALRAEAENAPAGTLPPFFASRGLFVSAVAASAGGGERDAAIVLGASILGRAGASAGFKVLAAAALTVLGDERGRKHLAGSPADWAGRPELMPAVLCACRAAGADATPVLLAGLGAADGPARAQLAELLAAHTAPEVRPALEKLLSDPDRTVRMAAAGSLVTLAGMEVADVLEGAYRREDDAVARQRLRDLLSSLGRRPAVQPQPRPLPPGIGPDPIPDPGPGPGPGASLTREAAMARLGREGKVLWARDDPVAPALTWMAVDKKFVFVHNSADGSLAGFGDFIKLIGRTDVTVAGLAMGAEMVWAGTDRGAFCYDRRTRAWSQIVINLDMDLVEAAVEKVELIEAGVAFTVKGRGRFEFNTRTRKWAKG
ncbi:MAG TPA: PQQ-binding-like beta-propeller repeat protein [Planctomycetota bacterium]|nr:PQQ-binding-like beta-propeller repeat protein [Planctomycetota bacterium]